MPRKPQITKEMVTSAAFDIARKAGWEDINARTVSDRLNCSTHPVMYHYATIEELKRAAYEEADRFHTEYLMEPLGNEEGVMLSIGVRYIRFAVEEPHLFKFLFQSGYAKGNSIIEMIDSEDLVPVLDVMQQGMGMDKEQTKEVFLVLAMFVHGCASLIANNSLEYDEKLVTEHLKRVYAGAVSEIRKEAE